MAKFIVPNHSFCNCMKHFQILEENELFVPSDDDDDDWSCFQKIWNKLKVRNFRASLCKFEWIADVTFHKRAEGWHKSVLVKGLWRSKGLLRCEAVSCSRKYFQTAHIFCPAKDQISPGFENGTANSYIKNFPWMRWVNLNFQFRIPSRWGKSDCCSQ